MGIEKGVWEVREGGRVGDEGRGKERVRKSEEEEMDCQTQQYICVWQVWPGMFIGVGTPTYVPGCMFLSIYPQSKFASYAWNDNLNGV